jgi:hypothetical protein
MTPMASQATLEELETVVLTTDVPSHGLVRGDVGAVVHVHDGGKAYEVEFVRSDGRTIALLTLPASQLRPRGTAEILHSRELAEVH